MRLIVIDTALLSWSLSFSLKTPVIAPLDECLFLIPMLKDFGKR